ARARRLRHLRLHQSRDAARLAAGPEPHRRRLGRGADGDRLDRRLPGGALVRLNEVYACGREACGGGALSADMMRLRIPCSPALPCVSLLSSTRSADVASSRAQASVATCKATSGVRSRKAMGLSMTRTTASVSARTLALWSVPSSTAISPTSAPGSAMVASVT